ncbi:hypothetical protein [uncultured Thiothrix sp.]|uniref:hypothetical protein n=1 Tax=uncultured Thiothrix sp. TaxID=223185 RepID=UPI00263038A9|nr:hypothetical protein [uncultured Thiothrix sp.]
MGHAIPSSMQAQLGAWNNSEGIDLESWIGCEGNFRLAIGYATLFWPNFIEFEDYIFIEGVQASSVRQFEEVSGCTPKSVEWTLNHLHIADIQHYGCVDISSDKLIFLGNILKEIYEAKLKFQFPNKPCVVEFYQPEDKDSLYDYQLSFWQKKHDEETA